MADETNTSAGTRSGGLWRALKLGTTLLVALALLAWAGRWFYHQHTHVSETDARVAASEITVSSRLAGRLTDFPLILGTRLDENDVIARLYSKPDRLELEKLQAQVKGAEAQVAYQRQQIALAEQQLQGGIAVSKGQLQSDLAAKDAARARLENAKATYARARRLSRSGNMSKQEKDRDYYTYQADQAEYERAKHQVAVDRSALENARHGMMSGSAMTLPNPDLLRAQLAVKRQSLAQARAELEHQRLKLSDMVVRSPNDGVVDKTFVDPGEYVSAGQPLVMMHKPGAVWVVAKIKETSIGRLAPGQSVAISVDAVPGLHFKGHIRVIGHAATNQFALLPNPNPSGNFTKITQRIPVRITIDEGPKQKLSPGMMVEVDIDTRAAGDRG